MYNSNTSGMAPFILFVIYILPGFYENEFYFSQDLFVIGHQTFHTFRAQAHKNHNYFFKTFFSLFSTLYYAVFCADATVALKEI